ncbi:MAG: PhzF family phenazine biosynthesis protein [Elusimicrobia bacterium]|nr:PhzF family phenazine biosynthesis protein [Elusimicrobiota bacterium]
MGIPIFQVDAFTDKPFAGNPAAVVFLKTMPDEVWMLAVAREMNLSETAFLVPEKDGWRLRWFTPAVEVDLCGHATLASAHVIYENGMPDDFTVRFYTKSGPLSALKKEGGIELDLPLIPLEKAAAPAGLAAALGAEPEELARSGRHYVAELSEAGVRALAPDFARLKALPMDDITVTARAGGEYDFVSRVFAPAEGLNEDPVTGSAHCALAYYWQAKLGKTEFNAYQASARGGSLRVKLAGGRVKITGAAVTIFRGELA